MSFVSIVPNTPAASTQDLAAAAGSKLGKRGRILEHSTFDNGSLQGWANQHWGTYSPQPPITTTTYPVITGTHALLLSTQEAPFALVGGNRPYGADVSAFKRLVNYNPLYGRYRSLSALVAVGSGGQVNEPAWMQWGLVMDVQRMDNTTRSFCRAYCNYVEPAYSVTIATSTTYTITVGTATTTSLTTSSTTAQIAAAVAALASVGGASNVTISGTPTSFTLSFPASASSQSAASVFTVAASAGTATVGTTYPYGRTLWYIINDAGALVAVPGSSFQSTGENENKMGYNYVRLTFDDQANGGVGGYYELQVNDKVFDLTGLSAGRGSQTPQAGNWMSDYRGGMNPGLLLNQRTTGGAAAAIPNNSWPAHMAVDQTLMTQGDVPA